MNFNSHAHVERDPSYIVLPMLTVISTHTLTWSVTLSYQINIPTSIISTHTLTWSVTLSGISGLLAMKISTHTLTWSVTLDVVYIWCLLNVMRTYFFI